jgi:hypothetical protein
MIAFMIPEDGRVGGLGTWVPQASEGSPSPTENLRPTQPLNCPGVQSVIRPDLTP